MNVHEHLERAEGHAVFRPGGDRSLKETVELITSAIASARDEGIRGLMVVLPESVGFESPRLAARYSFIHAWALAAGGLVRVAMVVPVNLIDPQKFGVTVAANIGMTANVFAAKTEALSWLLSAVK